MDEYISREEAINIARQSISDSRTHDFNAGCARVANKLLALPAADVRPVVRGAWVFSHYSSVDKFEIVKCTNCGYEVYHIAIHVQEGRFCPNCGAEMGGRDNA